MSPTKRRVPWPLCRRIVACRQALACKQFSTPMPSLCHTAPSSLVLRPAGKSGHKLAFSGVFQKFLWRIHRGHDALLVPRSPLSTYHRYNRHGQASSWKNSLEKLGHPQIRFRTLASLFKSAPVFRDSSIKFPGASGASGSTYESARGRDDVCVRRRRHSDCRETANKPGDYTVGKFTMILDLPNLPRVPTILHELPDSLEYDPRPRLIFLHEISREMSRPIARDDRVHVEYVPTQVVTEYLRTVTTIDGRRIDGIDTRVRAATRRDRHRQQLGRALGEPFLCGRALTLRAMARWV